MERSVINKIWKLCLFYTKFSRIDSLVNLNLTILAITSAQEMTTKKDILKVTDLLVREMPIRKNTPLLFIYKDGTVERKIIYK